MIVFDPADHPPAKCQSMLSSVIVPRPIAMISTVGENGALNVAPYSYFMPVTGHPPLLAVSMGARRETRSESKDTWANTQRTGEFVVNVTTEPMRDDIEAAAVDFPADVSEAELLGWTALPSRVVSHPGIAESPVHLECRVHQVLDLGTEDVYWSTVHLVVAEVVCITLDEAVCSADLHVDPHALAAVGRMTFPWFVQASGDALFGLERHPYEDYLVTGRLPGPLAPHDRTGE
jgi:flavin reductase (DIM6/NTAB) family NADH-FMN oxidoreductase RutF